VQWFGLGANTTICEVFGVREGGRRGRCQRRSVMMVAVRASSAVTRDTAVVTKGWEWCLWTQWTQQLVAGCCLGNGVDSTGGGGLAIRSRLCRRLRLYVLVNPDPCPRLDAPPLGVFHLPNLSFSSSRFFFSLLQSHPVAFFIPQQ